jgi:hypothetical protein
LRNERIQRLNAPADVVDLGRSRRRKADGGVQADQPGTLPDAEDGLVPTPGPGNKSDPALGHDNPDLISGINPNQVLGSLRSGCCVSGLYLEVAPDLHQDFTEIDEDRADTDMRPGCTKTLAPSMKLSTAIVCGPVRISSPGCKPMLSCTGERTP